ncbi:MAG: biotin/lipoyl-containing protein [Vicinamibacterales bacterium]
MSHRRVVEVAGQAVEFELHVEGSGKGSAILVQGTPEPLDVRRVGSGEYIVSGRGRVWRVWIAGTGARWQVFVGGHMFDVDLAKPGSKAPTAPSVGAPGGESAVAPMPATVVEIVVEAGQSVRRGDVLLKLEAMKMELPLRAPHDGRVAAVHCKPGDLVQPGALLVELVEHQDRTEE